MGFVIGELVSKTEGTLRKTRRIIQLLAWQTPWVLSVWKIILCEWEKQDQTNLLIIQERKGARHIDASDPQKTITQFKFADLYFRLFIFYLQYRKGQNEFIHKQSSALPG